MVIRMKPIPGFKTWHAARPWDRVDGDTEGLDQRQDHGQVAGPLGNLAPPQLAFLLELLERWQTTVNNCRMIDAVI